MPMITEIESSRVARGKPARTGSCERRTSTSARPGSRQVPGRRGPGSRSFLRRRRRRRAIADPTRPRAPDCPGSVAVHPDGMSLRTLALTPDDERLVTAARRVIADNYERGRHHIGAAVRMRDGRVFAGIHVEAHVGRITVCAEAMALGAALSAGARGVGTVVAV